MNRRKRRKPALNEKSAWTIHHGLSFAPFETDEDGCARISSDDETMEQAHVSPLPGLISPFTVSAPQSPSFQESVDLPQTTVSNLAESDDISVEPTHRKARKRKDFTRGELPSRGTFCPTPFNTKL